MKKIECGCIVGNYKLNNANVYKMNIANIDNQIEPGQFVMISVPGVYLPRPISVNDYDKDSKELSIVYRVVGDGTEIMSKMHDGMLNVTSGLGTGFTIPEGMKKPLVVGGGLGVAPLYYLVKKLVENNIDPMVILGFKNKEEEFYLRNFFELANTKVVYDIDGMLVTDPMKEMNFDEYDYFYACGPKPMLKAVSDISLTDGELSLESRMACGIGICKCCSVETNEGMKTLCKDGPVLKKGSIRW